MGWLKATPKPPHLNLKPIFQGALVLSGPIVGIVFFAGDFLSPQPAPRVLVAMGSGVARHFKPLPQNPPQVSVDILFKFLHDGPVHPP